MDYKQIRVQTTSYLCYAIVATLVVCGLATSVLAFMPRNNGGHGGIVKDAIRNTPEISRTSSTGETLKFSDDAVRQIRDATNEVDDKFGGDAEFSDSVAHCDNELLFECSSRIIMLKNVVINLIKNEATRDGEQARKELGRGLHTLQDFYSHSNWVDNPGPSNSSFNTALGWREF